MTFRWPDSFYKKTVLNSGCLLYTSDIAAEQRAKVVYQYLYRQIEDEGVREVIDFLLNREEAHNTMFRQAFNRIVDSGSQKDWGVTSDSRIYFDLSGDGQHFDPARKNPPEFKE